MKLFPRAVLLAGLAPCVPLLGFADTPAPKAAATSPNILILLADDLGYGDLGYTGCKDIRTPNIDRLAARSVICRDGHVAASVCSPSRCGLLTGLAPARQGYDGNTGLLLPDSRILARAMHDAGYVSLGVGKWHLGPEPRAMGFDHFTGLAGGGRNYFPMEKVGAEHRITRDGVNAENEGWTYLTDFLTEEGMRLVRQRPKDTPFFLYMSYTTPHTPLQPRPDLLRRYESIPHKGRRNYAAMVASLDEEVGQWLDFLDKEGLADNTLVFFLSDNGGATINWSDNGPWRGMKGSYWEGGQRVPFLVSWPGRLKPGVYDLPVSALDIFSTARAVAGRDPGGPTDGVNLIPYLRGEQPGRPHETLFWRLGVTSGVRDHDLMLIRTMEDDGRVHAVTLFDLASDPGQTRNLADSRPADRDRLLRQLDTWNATNAAPRGEQAPEFRRNARRKHEMDVVGRDAERRLP